MVTVFPALPLLLKCASRFCFMNVVPFIAIGSGSGKTVTIIKGFNGETVALKNLAKTLKNSIGVGGTVKNGEIIIQGNYRDSLIVLLKKMGHLIKRVGG